MAITATRLDGQNIGLRLTGGSTSVNVITVNLLTGETVSPYLSSVDLSLVQSAAVALFQSVPAGERATVTFLTRLITVAPADDNTLTLSLLGGGSSATLVATVSATPANLVLHVQHSISGYVAWGVGVSTGGGPPPPVTNNFVFSATCSAGNAVGDCVYFSGPEVGGVAQVGKADPSDIAKMPAVGVILSKTSATDCTVQRLGRLDLTGSAVSFTFGQRLFVGLSGQIDPTVPAPGASPSGHVFVQPVGVATAAQIAELNPSMSMIRNDA
jgi:hypothetical protein